MELKGTATLPRKPKRVELNPLHGVESRGVLVHTSTRTLRPYQFENPLHGVESVIWPTAVSWNCCRIHYMELKVGVLGSVWWRPLPNRNPLHGVERKDGVLELKVKDEYLNPLHGVESSKH